MEGKEKKMSRNLREESKTGFYHVMVRGVNRQKIFCDNDDRKHFLHLLKENTYKHRVEIHAFCLMENHVHILINAKKNNLSSYMRNLLTVYALYFNKKTSREGHLFGNRFKSEPVNDEIYFLTVLRYILQNPEKAFICKASQYPWSSYSAYDRDTFVNTEFALNYFKSSSELKKFINARNVDECLDLELSTEEKDVQAKLIIKYLLGGTDIAELKNLPKLQRDKYIREMKKNEIAMQRISNITGISISVVRKA